MIARLRASPLRVPLHVHVATLFVVLVLAKWSVGLPASFWGKDTLFRIPLFGHWLRWIGGIPVLRNAPQGVVAGRRIPTADEIARINKALEAVSEPAPPAVTAPPAPPPKPKPRPPSLLNPLN